MNKQCRTIAKAALQSIQGKAWRKETLKTRRRQAEVALNTTLDDDPRIHTDVESAWTGPGGALFVINWQQEARNAVQQAITLAGGRITDGSPAPGRMTVHVADSYFFIDYAEAPKRIIVEDPVSQRKYDVAAML